MPDGTPKKRTETEWSQARIASLARSFSPMSIRQLAGIAKDSTNDSARVAACNSILDRAYGKAEQSTQLNAEIQITIRKLFEPSALPGDACDAISQPKVIDVSPNASDETPKTTKRRNE